MEASSHFNETLLIPGAYLCHWGLLGGILEGISQYYGTKLVAAALCVTLGGFCLALSDILIYPDTQTMNFAISI